MRADLQPDGRRGYGGDLPGAGLAMGEARGEAERRASGDRGIGETNYRGCGGGAAGVDRRGEVGEEMMTSGEFPEFLTLVAYEFID